MRKRVSAVLTSALLASSLMLGACGSPASNSESTGEAAQTSAADSTSTQSTESTKVDVSQAVVGEWQTALYEMNGVVMSGDLSSVFGDEGGFTLSFDSAGTGTFGYNGQMINFTWEAKDDTTVTLTFEDTGEDSLSINEMDVVYDADRNTLTMVLEADDVSGTLTYTPDGTLESATTVDLSQAEAVTSIDQVVGTWSMCGFGSDGVLAEGDANALAEAMGGTYDPTLIIAADGKATDGTGADMGTLSVSDTGATLTESSITIATLKLYDDMLIMDMSELSAGETFMMYEK